MVSRKRNRGNARKARRIATSHGNPESPQSYTKKGGLQDPFYWPISWMQMRYQRDNLANCRHGTGLLGTNDPNVTSFCSIFEATISQKLAMGTVIIQAFIESIQMTDKLFPGCLGSRNFRVHMKSLYLCLGTQSVLHWETGSLEQMYAIYCAGVVIYLEAYNKFDDFKARCVRLKMKLDDVAGGGERATTLFFSKRIHCSCLKEKKRLVKSLPKTSICGLCMETKECKDLRRCGTCNVVQYCSESCQEADWPSHKEHCKSFWSSMKKCKESDEISAFT